MLKLSDMPKFRKFPIAVKRGSFVVKIYYTPSGGYDRFTVTYTSLGKRRRHTFSDLRDARIQAETIANKHARGQADALLLTNTDRLLYVRAVQTLRPVKTSLDRAAADFAEAHRILDGRSVIEAARDYARRHPKAAPTKMLPVVVDEFLKAKCDQGLSHAYLKDLRYRCGRLAKHLICPIASVTAEDIRMFFSELKLSARSHNNFAIAVTTLFSFAKSRGYLPKDHDEMAGVEKIKDLGGEIEIYSPAEMQRLLAAASDDVLPTLAIGGFAGLRSAEIQRLEWSDVRFQDRFIQITKGKAKNAARRLVPITDNLSDWLAPYAALQGRVWTHSSSYLYQCQASAAARTKTENLPAVDWKHNALRHSFISYRVAITQDVNKVALEAGNSPAMIFRHYRELVRPADATKWFSLSPEKPANVVVYDSKEA